MLYFIVSASFKNINKADYVGIDISVRILQAVSDTGLCCKIDYYMDFKKLIDRLPIFKACKKNLKFFPGWLNDPF